MLAQGDDVAEKHLVQSALRGCMGSPLPCISTATLFPPGTRLLGEMEVPDGGREVESSLSSLSVARQEDSGGGWMLERLSLVFESSRKVKLSSKAAHRSGRVAISGRVPWRIM